MASDHPVVYANAAFASLSGYPLDALLGKNLRMLQGSDREQDGRQRMREAVERGETARVLHAQLPPRRLAVLERGGDPAGAQCQAGELTHFIGYHRDASERLKGGEKTAAGPAVVAARGPAHGAAFARLLRGAAAARLAARAARLARDRADALRHRRSRHLQRHLRQERRRCLHPPRVARVIGASYRRGGDLVGRWEGGTFAALTQGDAAQKAPQYAQVVAQRVRDLLIHHPRNGAGRYLTISAGVASLVPERDMPLEALLKSARAALKRAKAIGKNDIVTAGAADFS